MNGLIGKKIGMTQIFDEEGRMVPVTVIEAGPCVVTQVKTAEKEGYASVQLGFGKAKKATKPLKGHLKDLENLPKHLKEFRLEKANGAARGQKVTVEIFKVGDCVEISGKSIGKGFAGRIKRWHFHRGPMAHGSKCHRLPGSIGAGTSPGRVIRGLRMAGRLGGVKVTEEKTIVRIDADKNLILVRGAVPGPDQGIVTITKNG